MMHSRYIFTLACYSNGVGTLDVVKNNIGWYRRYALVLVL